jgi:hypothetical protein
LRWLPPELLLELLRESDTLPLDAELALEADEARLSALAETETKTQASTALRHKGRKFMTTS